MPEADESNLVAIVLPAPEAAAAVARAWDAADAVAVLDHRLPAGRLTGLLAAIGPTHLLAAGGLRTLGGEPVSSEVGAVVSTSGTTGEPRLVALAQGALHASAVAVHRALGGDPRSDRWLACLPLHHVAGLAILARARATGSALVVHAGFDPDAVVAAAGECTLVSLVPTTLQRVLDRDASALGRFRRVLLGGGPIPAAARAAAVGAGASVVTTYGLTETGGGCVHDGHPLDGVEVKLGVDDEILVRGPVVMAGYHRDPRATAAALDSDGFLHTGDVGAWDAGGGLVVIDRRRDLIITGGVNVSPTAVDRALGDGPGVADVCVVGAADPEWGERVVACVVPADRNAPPSLASLRSHGAERGLTPAELPRELRVVAAIPRTAGGKPRRVALRR